MPYPNYHACDLVASDRFKEGSFRTQKRVHDGKEYNVIMGQLEGEDTMTDQSFRYSRDAWSESEARSHCRDHDGTFEAATGEEESRMQYQILQDATIARQVTEVCHQAWAMRPEHITAFMADVAAGAFVEAPETRVPRLAKIQRGAAILPIRGVIGRAGEWWSDVSVEWIEDTLRELMADKAIDLVILDLDTPGGTVTGVPELATTMQALRGGRTKIYGVATGIAASAGYWIGSAVDKLFVSPSASIGSIGVWNAHADISGMLESIGVKISVISAGKYKVEGNPWEPLGPEAREEMQSHVDHYYEMFLDSVAISRNTTVLDVRENYGQGRMLRPDQAKRVGAVDGVNTLAEVIEAVRPTGRTRMANASIAIAEADQ